MLCILRTCAAGWIYALTGLTGCLAFAQNTTYPSTAAPRLETIIPAADDTAWYRLVANCIMRADVSPEERTNLIVEALMIARQRGAAKETPSADWAKVSPPAVAAEPLTKSTWIHNPFAHELNSNKPPEEQARPLQEHEQLAAVIHKPIPAPGSGEYPPRLAKPQIFILPSYQQEVEAEVRPVLASAQTGPVHERLSDAAEESPVKPTQPDESAARSNAAVPTTSYGPLLPLPPKTIR